MKTIYEYDDASTDFKTGMIKALEKAIEELKDSENFDRYAIKIEINAWNRNEKLLNIISEITDKKKSYEISFNDDVS